MKALEWAATRAAEDITIYSDSKSSLAATAQRNNPHPLVAAIHQLIHRISPYLVIKFVWVKAHIGIVGNEAADVAAKAAASQNRSKEYASFPLSYAKHMIKEKFLQVWADEYLVAAQGSTTRMFFPTLADAAQFHLAAENSFEVTQFLTGHSFSRAYLKRFKIQENPHCPCDMAAIQDVRHLLEICPMYATARYKYVGCCSEINIQPFEYPTALKNRTSMECLLTLITHIVSSLKRMNS